MENLILVRRRALEASLQTVNYKISNLKKFFSAEQIRCWYLEREKICEQLKGLPTVKQVKESAKRMTEVSKRIHQPITKHLRK